MLDAASTDYVALDEAVRARDCILGISIGSTIKGRKGHEYRDLSEIVIRPKGKPDVKHREPIIDADVDHAATRLLRRFRNLDKGEKV